MKNAERYIEINHIVFYDGVCALCNRSVKWLIKFDKSQKLRYAPLQGTTALEFLDPKKINQLQSLVLWSEGKIYQRSEAFFQIIRLIGGINRIWLLFAVFPTKWLNAVYNLIAGNRYRWFGKFDSCPLPKPEVRKLFLD